MNFLYGDVVFLKKGDYIPFDAYILESEGLIVDETDVSGHSAVEKHIGVIKDENINVSDIYNSVFCGSFVLSGKAKVVVTDVGERVYTSKSKKINDKKYKYADKTVDIFKLFFLALVLISSVFTVIDSLISGEFIFSISCILILVAFFAFDFLGLFINFLFSSVFSDLAYCGCHLRNASVIESLNSSDVLLIEQDILFDEHSEISGFTNGTDEYFTVSEINKLNFAPFLYCAFGSFSALKTFNPSLLKSSVAFSSFFESSIAS